MKIETDINHYAPALPFLCKPNNGEDIIAYAYDTFDCDDGKHFKCMVLYSNYVDYNEGDTIHIHFMEIEALPKGSSITLTQE